MFRQPTPVAPLPACLSPCAAKACTTYRLGAAARSTAHAANVAPARPSPWLATHPSRGPALAQRRTSMTRRRMLRGFKEIAGYLGLHHGVENRRLLRSWVEREG